MLSDVVLGAFANIVDRDRHDVGMDSSAYAAALDSAKAAALAAGK